MRRDPLHPDPRRRGGAATVLAADALSERYVHDFYPLLVLAGAFGIHSVLATARPALRRAAGAAGVAAVLFSIHANVALALVYQRVLVWGVPAERRLEFQDWRERIDGMVRG